jgi:hypothetical protein
LKTDSHIDNISMQVRSVGYGIANTDPNPKSHRPTGWHIAVFRWDLFLDENGATYRAIDTVEHDQQGVAAGLDNAPPVLLDGWVDQLPTQGT